MQSLLAPCYLVLLKLGHFPNHPVLKHFQPMFVRQCEGRSFTTIKNIRQNYAFVYFAPFIFV